MSRPCSLALPTIFSSGRVASTFAISEVTQASCCSWVLVGVLSCAVALHAMAANAKGKMMCFIRIVLIVCVG